MCLLLLQALFIVANVLPTPSTTSARTINKRVFMWPHCVGPPNIPMLQVVAFKVNPG